MSIQTTSAQATTQAKEVSFTSSTTIGQLIEQLKIEAGAASIIQLSLESVTKAKNPSKAPSARLSFADIHHALNSIGLDASKRSAFIKGLASSMEERTVKGEAVDVDKLEVEENGKKIFWVKRIKDTLKKRITCKIAPKKAFSIRSKGKASIVS